MPQNTMIRNSIVAGALVCLGALAGWIGFQSEYLQVGDSQRMIAAVLLLATLWRLVEARLQGYATLVGWYAGAGSSIPHEWVSFFGNGFGWLGLAAFALLAALPVLAVPRRFLPFGLVAASAVTALSPLGMLTPLMAATAFLPGFGWLGLAFALFLLAIPCARHERLAVTLLVANALVGSVVNARYLPPDLPQTAWKIETEEGRHPTQARAWLARQARVASRVQSDIEHGAALIVTPEGTVDVWDRWAEAAWKTTADVAGKHDATLLVGVYRESPVGLHWEDGLLNPVSGDFYPATMPMLIGMWHPWTAKEHYPIQLGALTRTIPTEFGEAAYTICYEELLLWPLAAKVAAGDPALLISVANQWFTTARTSVAQTRSIRLQARLWGLPLLRAVNYKGAA